ncbi:urease accessory protein UreE [Pectinatus haikarae]|uniref:Urease accessory protein UreE n=1 Tax=Pectinatus haikarae TaxID=349096 RepID=A0ABT9Y4Q1_9FIRM|nr:urease accessory protein UreE [Pectinatus haikarae]MDQ0202719.1 urease accessory protein [Pectinatus haikarae]
MLIEHIKGNIRDGYFKNMTVDKVSIEWYDSKKKIHRLLSDKGRDIAVRLSAEEQSRGLCQGDVLAVFDGEAVTVDIIPSKCIIVSRVTKMEMITLCYETGNRHSPFYYVPDSENFLIPYDHPFEELLHKLNIHFAVENRRLDDRQRICASAGHNHVHVPVSHAHATESEHE